MGNATTPQREAIGGDTQQLNIYTGFGVPSHAAPSGSIYLRQDPASAATVLYVTHDGGTTWTALS